MTLAVTVASKTSVAGHAGQVAPSAAWFGSPFLANAPRLFIIASDKSRRPGRLAAVFVTLENSDGPKLPKTNGRSNAWAAP